MRTLFRKLRALRFRHEVLIAIFIHRDRILHNLRQFPAANPGVAVAPVLKSNAYGHGLIPIAKILDSANGAGGIGETAGARLPFLCVDSYVEALILRNEGIRTPLLVIGYTSLANIQERSLTDVAFAITSLDELRRLARECRRPVTIHLKIDTGMHRQGVMPEELDEALRVVAGANARNPRVVLEGAYSHLADADTPNSKLTAAQIELWNQAVRKIRAAAGRSVRYFHLANTAGSFYSRKIDANVMRAGTGLYGINTSQNKNLDLLPALEMKTRITSVRKIAAGESVGYNATFTAKRAMTVATIPVGYAEGLDRRLSNKGAVTVAGIACPFVGRVSMNMTTIDVSQVPDPKLDDEAVVVSADPIAANSIVNIARLCDTIPLELLIRLPAQIRRVVIP